MTPASSRVSNCSLTAAEPRSNRTVGRLFWRDRSEGPNEDIALEKEQKYAIRKGHNDFQTGVPIECPRNRSRNGHDLANPSWPSPFDARTIRQQYLQLRTYNSKYIPEVGLVPGAQHTRYHERFASRRKTAAVAAYFVNPYFWGAGRCPGRHPHYGRAGSSPGELGGGEGQESDDDICHPWPRRSFLWHQYSSGAISRCPLCRAAGCD